MYFDGVPQTLAMQKIIDLFTEALKGEEKEYTTGSIRRAIVLLSIPMILEMMMESLFAVVDVYFVGKVSVDAVATVGLTESVVMLVYSVAIGLSTAATAVVARRVGENNKKGAREAAVQAIMIGVVLSTVMGIIGAYFAEDILRLMGAEESVIATGVGYTRIIFGTNVVILLLFLLNGIFRGAGDASLAMRSLWLANGLNIILDPLLIFGFGPIPAMGVEGAAIATSIGRGCGVLFQLYILFRGSGIIKIAWRHFRVQWKIVYNLLDIALGGTLQFLIASASWIFLVRIISEFGSEVVAGYTFALRLIIFTILPSWGMANAAATLVGQNLGAQKPERAESSVWKTAYYNMIFLLVVSIIYFIWAESFMRFFTQEQVVIDVGVICLRIMCAGYVFFAYGMVISQAFNGAGDTRTPTLMNFVCFWLVEIPVAYLLALHWGWGPEGAFWAIAISETLLAIICIVLFRRGKWKLVKV